MKKNIKKIVVIVVGVLIVILLVGKLISAFSIKGVMNDAARGSFRNEFLYFLVAIQKLMDEECFLEKASNVPLNN